MTGIVKLNTEQIDTQQFLKILNNLEQSGYSAWEGRILVNLQDTTKYSYENLLEVFKSFKENSEIEEDELNQMRAILLKLDKNDGSISKKANEFAHYLLASINGATINKDDILEPWLSAVSKDDSPAEFEDENQNEDETEAKKTKLLIPIPETYRPSSRSLSLLLGALGGALFYYFFAKDRNVTQVSVSTANFTDTLNNFPTVDDTYKKIMLKSDDLQSDIDQLNIKLEGVKLNNTELSQSIENISTRILELYKLPIGINNPVVHEHTEKWIVSKNRAFQTAALVTLDLILESAHADEKSLDVVQRSIVALLQLPLEQLTSNLQLRIINVLFKFYKKRDCTNIESMHLINLFSKPENIFAENLDPLQKLILNSKLDWTQFRNFAYAYYLNENLSEKHQKFFDLLLLVKLDSQPLVNQFLDAVQNIFNKSLNQRSFELLILFADLYKPNNETKERIIQIIKSITLLPSDEYAAPCLLLNRNNLRDINKVLTDILLHKIHDMCKSSTGDEGIASLKSFLSLTKQAENPPFDADQKEILTYIIQTLLTKEIKNEKNIHELLVQLVNHQLFGALYVFTPWLQNDAVSFNSALEILSVTAKAMKELDRVQRHTSPENTDILKQYIGATFRKPCNLTEAHAKKFNTLNNLLLVQEDYESMMEIVRVSFESIISKKLWKNSYNIIEDLALGTDNAVVKKYKDKYPRLVVLNSVQKDLLIDLTHTLVQQRKAFTIEQIIKLNQIANILDIANSSSQRSFSISEKFLIKVVNEWPADHCKILYEFLQFGSPNKHNPQSIVLARALLNQALPFISLDSELKKNIKLKNLLGLQIYDDLGSRYVQTDLFWREAEDVVKDNLAKYFPESVKLMLTILRNTEPSEDDENNFFNYAHEQFFIPSDKQLLLTDYLDIWLSKYAENKVQAIKDYFKLELLLQKGGLTPSYALLQYIMKSMNLDKESYGYLIEMGKARIFDNLSEFPLKVIENIKENSVLKSEEKAELLGSLINLELQNANKVSINEACISAYKDLFKDHKAVNKTKESFRLAVLKTNNENTTTKLIESIEARQK